MSYREYDSDRSHRYHRRSIRLPKHDYSWTGAYFVTLHAKEHEPIFDIPELRKILVDTWEALPTRFPGVTLDEFVVMPDHVHFIIWLNGLAKNAPILGRVVGAYKSLTTVAWLRHIEANNLNYQAVFWQRGCFERCIREKGELENTRLYIRHNPDKLKSKNTASSSTDAPNASAPDAADADADAPDANVPDVADAHPPQGDRQGRPYHDTSWPPFGGE